MMRRVWAGWWGVAALATVAACAPRATPASRVASAATTQAPRRDSGDAEVVERAMPSVVLLLNTHEDGTITYGAGLLLLPGVVLTSQHVVAGSKALGAMLYKPGRQGYTPMDGGLSRYLFENQGDVVAAHQISGDATSDLAVVRIDANTSSVAPIVVAANPVKPGDRVLALGHPQEQVWSFTAGVVGAIQQGAIQHDAAIGQGSSGGPLLNARGEVVGINVAKVINEARGLAFARPIAFASRYLGDRAGAALGPLDLSTPESAAVSCWRGQELGRVDVGECFDWEFNWAEFRRLTADALRLADATTRRKIQTYLETPDLKERWIAMGKRHASGFFVDAPMSHATKSEVSERPLPREITEAKTRLERDEAELLRVHPELRGIHGDLETPAALKARLKLGIRAGRVSREGDKAWVELVGRNPDGTLYRFSELYAKVGDRWLQRSPLSQEGESRLPPDFAPPLESYLLARTHKLSWLLKAEGLGSESTPSAATAKVPARVEAPSAPASRPAPAQATPAAPPAGQTPAEAPASSQPGDKACNAAACAHGTAGEVL